MNIQNKKTESVKLVAFHLPQFHTFPENDEWWGKGFTEWTNTKKAKKLYAGHNQPREPYDDNYYDLTKLENMLWQMDLAQKYGVYGFCYYHYWFNGKLLLNKPTELIRDYDGDKLPYCLCWANEPWTRSWEGNTTKVLMPQEYGDERSWEQHFQYLLTYFNDQAYMKVDGCPILILYRCNNIPNCDKMIKYWDSRCKDSGFSGIYIIEEMNSFQEKACCRNSKGVLEFEPLYTMIYGRTIIEKIIDKVSSIIFNFRTKNNNQIYLYDRLWREIIRRDHKDLKKRFLGAFIDWDNTARKGGNGRIVMGATPEKFYQYLSTQVDIAKQNNSEFIFINAWNEWGEGTYLEPDKINEFKYLDAIRRIMK